MKQLHKYIHLLLTLMKKYMPMKNEGRDSLIQQAAHMQTAFSFVSAALFMVAAIIIDNRGRISLEFLLVAFSSISAVLLSSLFCATQAQKRYKRTSFPNARQLQRLIENQHGNFCSDAQRHKYVVKTYSEIHESLCNVNESRVKWIKSLHDFFLCSTRLMCLLVCCGNSSTDC